MLLFLLRARFNINQKTLLNTTLEAFEFPGDGRAVHKITGAPLHIHILNQTFQNVNVMMTETLTIT